MLAITPAECQQKLSDESAKRKVFSGKISGLAIKGPQMQKFAD
jgi:hypothetical protein